LFEARSIKQNNIEQALENVLSAEIVIPAGVTFADCANHLNLNTEWNNVTNVDRFAPVRELEYAIKKLSPPA
jgi:hypothetical protein